MAPLNLAPSMCQLKINNIYQTFPKTLPIFILTSKPAIFTDISTNVFQLGFSPNIEELPVSRSKLLAKKIKINN